MNLFLLLCLFNFLTIPAIGSDLIRFVSIEGEVSARDMNGNSKVVKVGLTLDLNEKVITGASGRARLLLPDKTIIDLKPKTEMLVAKLVKDKSKRDTQIEITKGDLRSSITKKLKKGEKVQIKTPVANFSIRGTDFNIQMNENANESLKLTVFEGEVEGVNLRKEGGAISLTAQNQATNFFQGEEVTKTLPLKESLALFEKMRVEDVNVKQNLTLDQEGGSLNTGLSTLQSAYQILGDLMKIPSSVTRVPSIVLPAGAAMSPYSLNFQTLTVQTEVR